MKIKRLIGVAAEEAAGGNDGAAEEGEAA